MIKIDFLFKLNNGDEAKAWKPHNVLVCVCVCAFAADVVVADECDLNFEATT